MKKATVILLIFSIAATAAGEDRIIFTAGLGILRHADPWYRGTYGPTVFIPEVGAAVRLYGGFYLEGGFGTFSKVGETQELLLPSKSTQSFLTVGLAYLSGLSESFLFKMEVGIADLIYREEAMEISVTGSQLGYQAGLGCFFTRKAAFVGLNLNYIMASDKVDEVEFKLGGARVTLALGIRIR
jgi:hypothetical protein